MKNSIYALVAVLMGVMLVGLLPGQLSNLATSAVELTSLQGSKTPGNYNVTVEGTGFTPSRSNSSGGNETVPSLADTATRAHADLAYYGMMAMGLIVALGVYLVSRRMLG